MTFEEALLTRAEAAPLAAELAPYAEGSAIHWGDRPEGAGLPAIVFTMVDPGTDYTHGGRDALRISSIQADVMAESYAAARAIADELGQLLEGAASVGGIQFSHGFIDIERDIPAIDVGGAPAIFGRTLRLSIYHKE
jgi:hypothetical protein